MTAPLPSRLGKWIPFNAEFPSPAQRAPREQAVSSNFASSSEVSLPHGSSAALQGRRSAACILYCPGFPILVRGGGDAGLVGVEPLSAGAAMAGNAADTPHDGI